MPHLFLDKIYPALITYHDLLWECYIHLIKTFLILGIMIRALMCFYACKILFIYLFILNMSTHFNIFKSIFLLCTFYKVIIFNYDLY